MSIKSTALKEVDPRVTERAERARQWMSTDQGREAIQKIVKRARSEENRMREAQRVGAASLNQVTL